VHTKRTTGNTGSTGRLQLRWCVLATVLRLSAICFCALWMLWTACSCACAAASFRAGAAQVDITPTRLPIRTAGNLTLTVVSNVHDRLHVRALVLDDGSTRLALAVVDSCMVAREDFDSAKLAASRITGIPVDHMLVSSTHTHTAPAVYGCHGNDPEPEYRSGLLPKITESIVLAWRHLQPAKVGWGTSPLPTFVYCRRWVMQPGSALHPNPAFTGSATNLAMMNPGFANTNRVRQTGPVDPAVTVLSLQCADGRPLAVLANYSTHYANAPSDQISADYFGEFCQRLAEDLHAPERNPEFVALMSNGTSGDANCTDFTQPGWVVNPPLVARAVVAAARLALDGIVYQEQVPLRVVQESLTLRTRLPSPEQVAQARAYLATNVLNRPTRNWEENYARETTLMADWPDRREVILQAFRVGEFGVAAVPCETYGSTGLALKRASPFPVTMVIGLANGYHGYLPPPDQVPLGGYTTWRARTSYLETEAEPKITATLTRLLQSLRR
jgi:hypothetical protein